MNDRPDLPSNVDIREVGPRDGLQPERPVTPTDRVRLIEALIDAGCQHIEAAAFVSPEAVPAMAGAAEVIAGIEVLREQRWVRIAALVPNVKGAELALQAGVDEITVTLSVSETYNQRNVRRSISESEVEVIKICELAQRSALPHPVDAVVSCAFGSPYEGDVAPADVAALGRRLQGAGVSAVTYADTTGMATPRRIDDLLDETGSDVGLHLHNTRGTALVNAYRALQRGVRRFDTSVGGIGGSPFATGSAGNLATEEFVAMLDDLDIETGIDVEAMVKAATLVGAMLGRRVPSMVATAGPRTRRAAADER